MRKLLLPDLPTGKDPGDSGPGRLALAPVGVAHRHASIRELGSRVGHEEIAGLSLLYILAHLERARGSLKDSNFERIPAGAGGGFNKGDLALRGHFDGAPSAELI